MNNQNDNNIVYTEKSIVKTIIKYGVTFVVCGIIAVLILVLRDFSFDMEKSELYRHLADAFSIPGLLSILLGCLIFLSNEGALSALSYMLKRLGRSLIPFSKKDDTTYAEYVEKRKKLSGFSFLFYIGLVYMVAAIVFIVLFYKA